jgi:hypothetical protein
MEAKGGQGDMSGYNQKIMDFFDAIQRMDEKTGQPPPLQ